MTSQKVNAIFRNTEICVAWILKKVLKCWVETIDLFKNFGEEDGALGQKVSLKKIKKLIYPKVKKSKCSKISLSVDFNVLKTSLQLV